VPRSVHVNVQEGERLRAGDPLNPMLPSREGSDRPAGRSGCPRHHELQRYRVEKIQEVYRSQSVAINEKHIEVICRQMLRSVPVMRVGDTDFLVVNFEGEEVNHFRFMEERKGHEPRRRAGRRNPLLLGMTLSRWRRWGR
jgi:DNA-directed RNA polymerase subunit beta'